MSLQVGKLNFQSLLFKDISRETSVFETNDKLLGAAWGRFLVCDPWKPEPCRVLDFIEFHWNSMKAKTHGVGGGGRCCQGWARGESRELTAHGCVAPPQGWWKRRVSPPVSSSPAPGFETQELSYINYTKYIILSRVLIVWATSITLIFISVILSF